MTDSFEAPELLHRGRLMGLDYGTKRVGVAISTFEQSISSPLEIIYRQHEAADAKHLKDIADEYEVVGIVVGLPVHTGGEEGQKAFEAREFGAWVGKVTGRPVAFWDERFTTVIAEDILNFAELSKAKRRRRVDMLAAQIMLQSFLDSEARNQWTTE